ncbi:hemolysin family protein [Antarcticirhabdus aurantiaca]|uniref:Hemolysin family protein n=1 Tax=Antarcticirhabdus aurantiaca TaxID=2606717 RepID=A0ACD4NLN5_9HYPH|nr:hemolysin family protein [Antarcticirhabdus aurantiaca]WAJ27620.1 hemolysin family protein [Jeongeuplla avenae]
MLLTNALIVFFLILVNGYFAMSELALVSSRRSRLAQMQKEGRRGATSALNLLEDPTTFLSTVQVGITLVGIFSGAYGGQAFAGPLADVIENAGLAPVGTADTFAFIVIVIGITYLSLIFGELVPKRFAMRRAEAIACFVAPVMTVIAKVGAPIVWLLRVSTEAVSKLVGVGGKGEEGVTEEDVKAMIAEGTESGVFEPKERQMLEGVLRIADRTVRSIMVPRPDTVWLDLGDPASETLEEIVTTGHSRFPVIDRETDDVVGVVQVKDLLEQQRRTGAIDLAAAMREPLYVHETLPILKLLERFRTSNIHMAVVLDEYGSFEGVATPTDILIAIAGSLPEGHADDEVDAHRREDGSWLVDAALPVDDVAHLVPGIEFPLKRDYTTLAGYVLERLGHIPEVGESFHSGDWKIEVIDLDGRRIDKLLLIPPRDGTADPAEQKEESGTGI